VRLIVAFLVVSLTTLAGAQQPAPVVPQVELADPTSSVRAQLARSAGFLGQVACDKNGAIYLQPEFAADDNTGTPGSAIIRISSDGSIARYSADPSGAKSHTYVLGHAVDRDGRVFLLTMRPGPGDRLTVLQLSPDSSIVSKTDLDRQLRPGLFAVLPSGDFLISGVENSNEKDAGTRKSVLWLFGSDGTFKRQFLAASTKVDVDPKTRRPAPTPATVDFTSLQIGDDNNIYILQPGSPVKVVVFDETGVKQRTLRLDAPPQATLDVFLFVGGGRVVVPFRSTETGANGKKVSKRIFRVYDAQTGIAEIDYISTFPGIVACLDNNDLEFLVPGKDGALSIARAAMR
jgi:hypothetical protein